MTNVRIPAWWIAVAVLILIVVVLERLYLTKAPVKVLGIELVAGLSSLPVFRSTRF